MRSDCFLRARRALLVTGLGTAATLALSGCAPLLIGGAMLGGTLVYADRRTSGAQLEDEAIELKAAARLRELLGDKGRASVTSYNRVVLITGEVLTEADKTAVRQAVERVENVRTIVNEVVVAAESSLSSRSNDALLSAKVKASLVEAKDLMSQAIKVVTDRRTVYLMGTVTEREAERAADIARRVGGVQRVVRVFEVVSEAELARMAPPSK
jgi:osmotically-inducible protein OsmY